MTTVARACLEGRIHPYIQHLRRVDRDGTESRLYRMV